VVYGEWSLQCAEAMQNLATVMDGLGHNREAEQLLVRALDVEEEVRCQLLCSVVSQSVECPIVMYQIISCRFVARTTWRTP
jgi:hypothetical protein